MLLVMSETGEDPRGQSCEHADRSCRTVISYDNRIVNLGYATAELPKPVWNIATGWVAKGRIALSDTENGKPTLSINKQWDSNEINIGHFLNV